MTRKPAAQSANSLLRSQFRMVHGLLGGSIDGLNNVEAACCAQAVLREDLTVNGILAAQAPLALSTWQGRTGLSELPLFAAPIQWRAWARRVRFDAGHFGAYASSVYAATDGYLAIERPGLTVCLLNALLLTIAVRRPELNVR